MGVMYKSVFCFFFHTEHVFHYIAFANAKMDVFERCAHTTNKTPRKPK